MASPRLSLVDQLFSQAVIFLAIGRVLADPAGEDLMIELVRETLPRVSDHPQIRPLVHAAITGLAILDEVPANPRARSILRDHLQLPALRFVHWRAALARDALAEADATPRATAAE